MTVHSYYYIVLEMFPEFAENNSTGQVFMQENRFDKAALNWDEVPERIEMAKHFATAIEDIIPLASNMQVLDFGSGTGNVAIGLAHLVETITAVDSSTGMIKALEKKLAESGIKNIKPLLTELDEGSFPNASFDLIYTCMTFHHIKDIERVLRLFYKMLTPCGYLVLIDLEKEDGSFHDDKTGVAHFGFEPEQLGHTLENVGFTDIYSRTAYTRVKTLPSGISREYPIFLITGMKSIA